ncbi:MAG: tyrosine-type recombinase/integrase, partial [Eubacteriales bacterium]
MEDLNDIQKMQEELAEVRRTLNSLTDTLNRTICEAGRSYSLYAWLGEWLAYKGQYIQRKGLHDLTAVVDRYIKPKITDRPMTEVKAEDLQGLTVGVPPAVRETLYRVIHGAFTRAFNLHIIPVNVAVNVERATYRRNVGKSLTKAQIKTLLEVSRGYRVNTLIRFLLLSGCRRGETGIITWDDIDFTEKTIHIRGTKSASADRMIPFFGNMEEVLSEIPRIEKHLFPQSYYSNYRELSKIRESCGFHFRFHDLRHTFATHCMECGIQIATISRWLGHVS